jgi:putative ABC transport system permease protein
VTLPGKSTGWSLLRRSAWRYALQHRWQTVLNILGILIGVMMVVAVDLANTSARQAFDASIEILNGNITHQIVGGSDGVPEVVFTRLKTELGIRRAAPSLSGQVRVNNSELTLVGMDVISEGSMQRQRPGLPDGALSVTGDFLAALGNQNTVIIEQTLADRLGLQAGDDFTLFTFSGSHVAKVAAVFAVPEATNITGDILLADIASAQNILGSSGRLDSIDLAFNEANDAALNDDMLRQLRNWLPANLLLVESQARNDNLRQMSEAFHINLLAMSLLSLLVAALLIYNTVTLSVIQRRETLGIFRAQGVTQQQVFTLVLLENGVIGLIASVLGVTAGYFLGRFLVTMVTGTVDSLYFNLAITDFILDPLVLVKGLLLGILLSLFSSALPAWYAARSKPVTLQHHAAQGSDWKRFIPRLALGGLALMGLGGWLLLPEYGSLVTGFFALTLVVAGFCLLVPLCVYGFLSASLIAGSSWLKLSGVMALRNARSAINRTSLAVAALCVAVSVTVGVGVMVGSFRGTVILWLEQSLPGDIQLIVQSAPVIGEGISMDLRRELADLNGINGVHHFVLEEIESEFGLIRLGMNGLPAQEKFLIKNTTENGLEDFDAGQGVFISEPMAYLQELELGDSIELLTRSGMTGFPVMGVFYDYTSGYGMVHMSESLYSRHWETDLITRATLELVDGSDEAMVLADIEALLADRAGSYTLVSNRQLRQLTLQIFDRTFAITNVLRLLAILVAFVGVVSTLMALQLEKGREFAILRATGMTPAQTSGLILKQTTVLGIIAGLLALPLGLLMSDILIDVINRRSFGWTMQHFLPERVLLEGVLLAVVAAVLAGLYPAWRAGRIRTAVALREE